MILVALLSIAYSHAAIIGEWDDPYRDDYEPNKGEYCDQPEGIKWYVDAYREKVYPFYYYGCGGDINNIYDSIIEAEKYLPKDSGQCEGFNMVGWPTYGENEDEHFCPPGSSYLPYGDVAAICCDDATAERYRLNKAQRCPNKEEPLTFTATIYDEEFKEIEVSSENRTWYGKSCSHDFCPEDSECVQGEFEAFCCEVTSSDMTSPEQKQTTKIISGEKKSDGGNLMSFGLVGPVVVVIVVIVVVCLCCKCCIRRKSGRSEKLKEDSCLNP